jgi:starvation-inducible DNA-binding protein
MEKLVASLRIVLGNTFTMYFKAHSYHWNVEGVHFSQYHDFFGDIYEDVYGAVDPLSEEIRKTGVYAPISLMELYGYKTISEDSSKPASVNEMLFNLLVANTELLSALSTLFDIATAEKQQGLANFVADRMDKHKKFEWQIKSSLEQAENK